ncbi:hypothetical protein PoB_003919100 [Plakobranchus ocellatus]|uniref:Uncharacterized protein n=1 Tax=Plakobranchus ocellatus TaxID=259542 RepID=A0AAV4ANE7_9GAST|nr:hypothetical protein PoB_003919100 [Plakobranchus ocellatus]
MHDLIEELGTSPHLSTATTPSRTQSQRSGGSPSAEDTEAASLRSESHQPNQDTQADQAIRICVNGVTVDSSDDLASASGSVRPISVVSGDNRESPPHRKNARLRDGGNEVELLNRRGSWCPEPDAIRTGLPLDRRDQQTRVRMLAMTGKSLSLTSLDGGEESDEEDLLSSPTEEVPPVSPLTLPGTVAPSPPHPIHSTTAAIIVRQQQRQPQHSHSFSYSQSHSHGRGHHRATRTQSDAEIERETRNRAALNSTGSSRSGLDIGEELSLSTQNARSLNDISVTAASSSSVDESPGGSHTTTNSSPGGPAHRPQHSYDDGTALVVPLSNMTKSLSTPSIPQATEATGASAARREGKQHDANAFQSFLDDYDPQFRRQKEIEEEEEDESSSSAREKKGQEISWRDFLSEEQSPNDSDEKSSKGVRHKEDKKRKPSVFSRFQSSYRTKKQKVTGVVNAYGCDSHNPSRNTVPTWDHDKIDDQ